MRGRLRARAARAYQALGELLLRVGAHIVAGKLGEEMLRAEEEADTDELPPRPAEISEEGLRMRVLAREPARPREVAAPPVPLKGSVAERLQRARQAR